MRGSEFLDVLRRLIGVDETARCLSKICNLEALDDKFLGQITNVEALAAYVYTTAMGWHSYINEQLWSGRPNREVVAIAQVLNSALSKIVAITGNQGTVYRGYSAHDLDAFSAQYAQDEIERFPAFTSASFSQASALGGDVLFIIRALSARAIWWLSPNFHEEEALLPTDCSFRVVDKFLEHGRLVIVLQETTKRP
jgi:hypothetical protein